MDTTTLGAALALAKSIPDTAVSEAAAVLEQAETIVASIPEDYSELSDDVIELKSTIRAQTEDVISIDSSGTVSTWAGVSKNLIVQKGYVSNKSGKVVLSCYNISTHSSFADHPFVFVLMTENNGVLTVIDKKSVDTPGSVGLFTVDTGWSITSDKKYYVGVWRDIANYVPYISSSEYGSYYKSIWDTSSDITIGATITISTMGNAANNTIVLNISVVSDIGIVVDALETRVNTVEYDIDDIVESIGNLNDLANPADSIVSAINGINGETLKITDFPMTTASTWAGMDKGVAILDAPIIGKSGIVTFSFYNTSNHSSWANIPFWFILYERTGAGTFTVVSKKSVDTPSSVGSFTVNPGWAITDDKIYYIGVWRNGAGYLPYINGGYTTFYKASVYSSDSDISVGSTISLSDLSAANNNSILMNISVKPDGNHVEKQVAKKRLVHFSVDDCVFWNDLITNESNYSSCFENTQLGYWKKLHDLFGVCVTLNCFCTNSTSSIADVPDKWAAEFAANAYWLKFAFHAEDSSTYYDTDKVDAITASYNTFVTAIIKMTGTPDAIDPITRLGFYSGTLANVQAIRDAKCGVTGLLTSDDTRISYYLATAQNTFILGHNMLFDADNQILFVHTMPRLESVGDTTAALSSYLSKDWQNQNEVLEFFTHETVMNSNMELKVETYANWALINGMDFGFPSNAIGF